MIYQSLRFYIHVNGLGYKFTPTYIYIYIYIYYGINGRITTTYIE